MACKPHEETAKEKADFVMTQLRTAREKPPWVRCFCKVKIYLPLAYRCLYCGEWYCPQCAEKHFGQTRKEWADSNPRRAELERELQEADL